MIRVAALPYRFTDTGSVEVLLITSRRKRRWILPKGKLEFGEDPEERALQEAYEEAGVEGGPAFSPIQPTPNFDPSQHRVYPVFVTCVLNEWPEMNFRERRWVSISEALATLKDEAAREAILALSSSGPDGKRGE